MTHTKSTTAYSGASGAKTAAQAVAEILKEVGEDYGRIKVHIVGELAEVIIQRKI